MHEILRINLSSVETENKLLVQLTKFYEKHDRLNDFMRWSIIQEVENTGTGSHFWIVDLDLTLFFVDVPDDLFRKGSIATGVMFNFLFSDLGKTYLKSTVLPMIQQVEDLTEDMVSILYHLRRHNKRSSTDFLLVLPHCNQQTFLN